MDKAVLPKNIKPAYICETCEETWFANDKEKPWEKHSLKRMRKKGLELKIGEVFDYNGRIPKSDLVCYRGIIIASEPSYDGEHRRGYGVMKFYYDALYQLAEHIERDYISNYPIEYLVREYSEQEFNQIIKMLRKNPDFQRYRKRDFESKDKLIVRGILRKK